MLSISWKNTTCFYAYWLGQCCFPRALNFRVTRSTYEFCIPRFCFPSEVMGMLFPQRWRADPHYFPGNCWSKERFLQVWPFSGGKYLISERLPTNWFVIHTRLWFTGALLFWANQASWILLAVVWAPPFEVSQTFFGSGFQSVCKLIWTHLAWAVRRC